MTTTGIHRPFLILGALQAALAVAMGAFAAHKLAATLDEAMLQTFRTAAIYQFHHALGLCIVALAAAHLGHTRPLIVGGWLLFAGSLLFPGSLYLLVLTGKTWLGAVTPFGGAAFILGWILVASTAAITR